MRDRLIELLKDIFNYTEGVCLDFDEAMEISADCLLSNGVIVPPCKVGDKVYYPNNDTRTVYETKVYCICKDDEGGFIINPREYPRDAKTLYGAEFGKTVFLSKEEAEEEFQNEQKPCPFCGGKVRILYNSESERYEVECKKCYCTVMQYSECKDEAIKAWNRRADKGGDG